MRGSLVVVEVALFIVIKPLYTNATVDRDSVDFSKSSLSEYFTTICRSMLDVS
jgi:hypothetical protein